LLDQPFGAQEVYCAPKPAKVMPLLNYMALPSVSLFAATICLTSRQSWCLSFWTPFPVAPNQFMQQSLLMFSFSAGPAPSAVIAVVGVAAYTSRNGCQEIDAQASRYFGFWCPIFPSPENIHVGYAARGYLFALSPRTVSHGDVSVRARISEGQQQRLCASVSAYRRTSPVP